MRFEPRKKRLANPIGRRESRSLLLLVMLLGFILVLVGKAMQPQTWNWLFDRGQPQPAQIAQEPPTENPDTRIEIPDLQPRLEGEFSLPPVKQSAETPDDTSGYFSGVQPGLLSTIEDNRELNDDELAPRKNLIEVLKHNPQQNLIKASAGVVGFRQLLNQPDVYRGKLVTVVGTVRQAEYEISPVADGVDRYFVMWMRLEGGPARPVVVYCLEKPPKFPEGKKLAEEVRVTGFFFKKRAYEAQDTFRTAPAIFAKSFDWKPAPKVAKWQATDEQLAWMIGGAAALALLIVAIANFRTRQKFASRYNLDLPSATIHVNDEQVLPSVGEQLSEIVDQDSK